MAPFPNKSAMAGQVRVWDTALELTKSARDPAAWALQLGSALSSGHVALPSPDLAHLLVSHICFDNHVPLTWKLLERSLSSNLAPPFLVLALLSSRVVPNRKLHPAAYRLYMELVKRHVSSSSLASLVGAPHHEKIMESIDDVIGLSRKFDLRVCEPGILLVEFVFYVVWQLLDASLDDEGLLELVPERRSALLSSSSDMEIDSKGSFPKIAGEGHERLIKENTVMAIEFIGEFFGNRVFARMMYLAQQNMPSHWRGFVQRVRLLATQSAALRSSKSINPELLLQLTSESQRLLTCKGKTMQKHEFSAVISKCSPMFSGGQCHGTSRCAIWLPIDLFLEDVMDAALVAPIGAGKQLTGLVKSLNAVNGTVWHDTFLGLWTAALRLVQRERDPSEGPVPRIDTGLCVLFSVTTLAVTNIIEEEEYKMMCEGEGEGEGEINADDKRAQGQSRAGLISCLQMLGDYQSLLNPPQSVISVANQAAAKASMFISGLTVNNGYHDALSMNDMPVNCTGNLRHLIVEACIARNLLDTLAYFWPGYVTARPNQLPRAIPSQSSGWSSLMKGSLLTPSMLNVLVATPAPSLTELEKIYEIAVHGSDDEKILAATVLCGASLVRGWNVQEHTLLFIVRLLSPPVAADYSGRESHLINHAALLNILLVGISPVDCIQIFSLHGLVPILASALMPICEVFGSLNYCSWTLPSGEELSCHAVFSNAFTLLLRLWRFDQTPLEHVMNDVRPVGTQLSPEFLLMVRNRQLSSSGYSPKDHIKSRRFSKTFGISLDPVYMDSFPKLKLWYRHHLECIASTFSGLVCGTPVHEIVDAILNLMFKRNRIVSVSSSASGSCSSSGSGADDAYARLKIPAWDILEACPFSLDAALTACAHGRLSPRELATGLKDLADFLPASLAAIVSYFSAEVTRGIWKPAFMNGTDWPSPAANLAYVEQQIKKILAATGVDVPSLTSGGSTQATLPLPLASLVSLTITYKLEKGSDRYLYLVGPCLNSLATSCPWPCMPIVTSLWAQKVKRWNDFLIFFASRTVFHHNHDAVVQLLKSCFMSTLGSSSPNICSNGGVGALLGHGFGSQVSGGMSAVAPGILYLRVHKSIRNVIFLAEEILSLLMHSVREIASGGLSKEAAEKLKKTKYGVRYERVSFGAALGRVKLAASLGASLVWLSGGPSLVQSLIKETLPSWFISVQGPERAGGEFDELVAMLGGYALAYMALLSGTFAWGLDSMAPASKRRPKVIEAHLEFLASALDGKISLGCTTATTRAYVTGFVSLMVSCTPAWVLEVDANLLKRLSKGLLQWNEGELALALLGLGGVHAMGAAAELIIEMR